MTHDKNSPNLNPSPSPNPHTTSIESLLNENARLRRMLQTRDESVPRLIEQAEERVGRKYRKRIWALKTKIQYLEETNSGLASSSSSRGQQSRLAPTDGNSNKLNEHPNPIQSSNREKTPPNEPESEKETTTQLQLKTLQLQLRQREHEIRQLNRYIQNNIRGQQHLSASSLSSFLPVIYESQTTNDGYHYHRYNDDDDDDLRHKMERNYTNISPSSNLIPSPSHSHYTNDNDESTCRIEHLAAELHNKCALIESAHNDIDVRDRRIQELDFLVTRSANYISSLRVRFAESEARLARALAKNTALELDYDELVEEYECVDAWRKRAEEGEKEWKRKAEKERARKMKKSNTTKKQTKKLMTKGNPKGRLRYFLRS